MAAKIFSTIKLSLCFNQDGERHIIVVFFKIKVEDEEEQASIEIEIQGPVTQQEKQKEV